MSGRVVAYVPDLMDRSKVAALDGVVFVASADELPAAAATADLVVVDLSRPGVVDALPSVAARTIGFAGHASTELLDAARAAGCDEVLTRSQFFARVARGTLTS